MIEGILGFLGVMFVIWLLGRHHLENEYRRDYETWKRTGHWPRGMHGMRKNYGGAAQRARKQREAAKKPETKSTKNQLLELARENPPWFAALRKHYEKQNVGLDELLDLMEHDPEWAVAIRKSWEKQVRKPPFGSG